MMASIDNPRVYYFVCETSMSSERCSSEAQVRYSEPALYDLVSGSRRGGASHGDDTDLKGDWSE